LHKKEKRRDTWCAGKLSKTMTSEVLTYPTRSCFFDMVQEYAFIAN